MTGKDLKIALKNLNMSQRRFARCAGVSANTITTTIKKSDIKISDNLMIIARLLTDFPEIAERLESYERKN